MSQVFSDASQVESFESIEEMLGGRVGQDEHLDNCGDVDGGDVDGGDGEGSVGHDEHLGVMVRAGGAGGDQLGQGGQV